MFSETIRRPQTAATDLQGPCALLACRVEVPWPRMIPFRSIAKCLVVLLCLGALVLYIVLWVRSYDSLGEWVMMHPSPQSPWRVRFLSAEGGHVLDVSRGIPFKYRSPKTGRPSVSFSFIMPYRMPRKVRGAPPRSIGRDFVLRWRYSSYQLGFPYWFGACLLAATIYVLVFDRFTHSAPALDSPESPSTGERESPGSG